MQEQAANRRRDPVAPVMAALCAGLALVQVATYAAPPELWKGVHWLVSYDMGWLKRALPGTILAAVAPQAVGQFEFVALFGLLSLAFVLASFSLWAVRCYRARPTPATAALIVSAYLSPLLVSFWAEDVGRFDQLLYGLVLLLLVPLQRAPRFALVPVLLLAAFGVLVHEAFLLLQLPLLLACWLEAERRAGTSPLRALVGVAAVGSLTYAISAVLSGGGMANMQRATFLAKLVVKASFPIDQRAVFMYFNDLFDTIRFTLGEKFGSPLFGLLELAKSLLAIGVWGAIPLLFILRHARRTGLAEREARLYRLPLAALALVPFTLFPIGVDWGRWCSCIVLNLFAFAFFATSRAADADDPPWPAPVIDALDRVAGAGYARPLQLAAFLMPLTWGVSGPTVGTPFAFDSELTALLAQAWEGLRLLLP